MFKLCWPKFLSARPLASSLLVPALALSIAGGALLNPGAASAQGKNAAKANQSETASAQPVPEPTVAAIRAALEAFTQGRYKVDEVRRTPLPGLYEARIGNDLLYIDGKGQFLFWQGDLIDMKSQRNLTQERVEDLMAIRFEDLPLELAVKQVNGKGGRRIAVFEDPNCGFCKRLRADLMKVDNVTIYMFPLAFLAADSETKARKALCASDKVKAWNDLLLRNKQADNAGTCDTSLEEVRALSQKLGISGTPVVFFESGKRLQGYEPPERFNKRLADNSKG
jgi:thiol:disulfide interchange protein DsbC